MDLAIPTITRFDHLERCVQSAMAGILRPDNIYIMDNSEGGQLRQETSWTEDYDNLTIYIPGQNLGVAAAWNFFLTERPVAARPCIISNDDVVLGRADIADFALALEQDPDAGIFYPDEHKGNEYSLFLLQDSAYRALGAFDEQFWPAYYEDSDYERRRTLAGVRAHRIPGLTFTHYGSATMKAMHDGELCVHHRQFDANTRRYVKKWGGLPSEEVYPRPYDTPLNVTVTHQATTRREDVHAWRDWDWSN
jgi:GT2 family glycosyltransferase